MHSKNTALAVSIDMKGFDLMNTALTIIQLVSCVVIVLVVLLQSGKSSGLTSVFGGNTDTYMSRNKAKAMDARLAKATKWVAIVFVVLTLLLNIVH